ncbi:MAG: UbiA family prenyltransferase [Bacteroidetes bacterium]|nr:UbiA family prenyltransferase [Bacteroidota bacterium]
MKKFFSLVKFSHTIFALPFAIIGFFLAVKVHGYNFELKLLGLVIICMVSARNAAMGFNRYIDSNFDKKNPRTAIREIPSGVISKKQALLFIIFNCFIFVIATYFINQLCFFLSPVALMVILGYSYTKRFTALCHLVLGLGLGLAPLGAYLSVSGKFHPLAILFSVVVLTWVSGFDIIYALQDTEFDEENDLHSIPSTFGKNKALRISSVLHVLSVITVINIGIFGHFGTFYWAGTFVFCSLLFYQHTLVKADDLSKVNMAFFTTNGFASIIFAIFFLLDIFLNG